ncbi:MAG: EamA family transporter RarD [Candidatus Vecturithrix sp.]|jgi:chloramphenicol-sensitive protein RarD|nr:EamA family transporter RarD [Candidatus Vecturithrix sp.]
MMVRNHSTTNEHLIGVFYGIAAFGLWGLLPVYWKLLQQVSALEVLAHRIFWSFIFLSLLLLLKGQWSQIRQTMSSASTRRYLLLSAAIISANWFIYIWAIMSAHIIEASLGYYITPLFNVLLGFVVLRERMTFWQYAAVFLAFVGVLMLTVRYGQIPWIGLSLAISFSTYGLLKKLVRVDSLTGLSIETLVVSPFCLGVMGFKHFQGSGAFGNGALSVSLLLIFGGVVTALPLLWFAQSAKRIPLSQLGFLQYLSPTISLLLGVFLYHEPFTSAHLLSFGCIWIALAIYTLSQMGALPKLTPASRGSQRRLK